MNDDPIMCSEDDLVQLLRLSLTIENVPVSDDPKAQTDVGLVRNINDEMFSYIYTYLHVHICRQQMNSLMSMQEDSIQQLLK